MINIILDTSFLITLVTKPIKILDDITINYGKINFLIPDIVIEELNKIKNRKSYKISQIARTALETAKQFEIVNTKKLRYPDDSLLDYAISYNCAIATVDKNLIKRSLSEKIMTFSLKNNKVVITNG
ncbi:MAG TPA: PIN domain-containing protein [Nitrososphaeraceae archaeon]|nr:PIN domain-containing protein [Nitrososphaeraceae archaeon]